jgi:hypothetical protein
MDIGLERAAPARTLADPSPHALIVTRPETT